MTGKSDSDSILDRLNEIADKPVTFIGDTIRPQTNTIKQIVDSLEKQDWSPVALVTSDSALGRVEMVVWNATVMPMVKFRAIPFNSFKLPQNFDDMEAALRYVGFAD